MRLNHSEQTGTTSFQLLGNVTGLGLMLFHVSRDKEELGIYSLNGKKEEKGYSGMIKISLQA